MRGYFGLTPGSSIVASQLYTSLVWLGFPIKLMPQPTAKQEDIGAAFIADDFKLAVDGKTELEVGCRGGRSKRQSFF